MSWLLVTLLGGVVGLDATSFPQAMLARPLVASALTGLVFGRPAEGIMVGLVLEAFSLIILPIGAARYPESGTASVAATAACLAATPSGLEPHGLLLALALGLAWEPVTGYSVIVLRRLNGRRINASRPLDARRVARLHLSALALDFARGGVVTLAGALLGLVALRAGRVVWGLGEGLSLALLTVLVIAMIATAAPLFGLGRRARIALVAGLGGGVLLALVAP